MQVADNASLYITVPLDFSNIILSCMGLVHFSPVEYIIKKAVARPTILYGRKAWILSQILKSRVNAIQIKCFTRVDSNAKRNRIRN